LREPFDFFTRKATLAIALRRARSDTPRKFMRDDNGLRVIRNHAHSARIRIRLLLIRYVRFGHECLRFDDCRHNLSTPLPNTN
jgi:hypothetical protein